MIFIPPALHSTEATAYVPATISRRGDGGDGAMRVRSREACDEIGVQQVQCFSSEAWQLRIHVLSVSRLFAKNYWRRDDDCVEVKSEFGGVGCQSSLEEKVLGTFPCFSCCRVSRKTL